MKPKKIAILYAGAEHWGGVETYLEQLFVSADKTRLDLTLVSIGHWELFDRLSTAGYKTKEFSQKWYDLRLVNLLAKYLMEEKYDLVTGQGLVANYFSRLSAQKARIPNLITIHSDYKFDYTNYKRYIYWLSFVCLKSLTCKYITVSNFLKREAMKLGVKENDITVVYNGVKEVVVKPKKRGKEVIFGSLGRLHYKKGYQGLIKAASLISDLDFKVYIWGEGDDRNELEQMIKNYKLDDRVILRGFTKDITAALSEIDIYIQPSLEEGFGITVAEGMYAGKPVIVTPAGSLPELITDGKTGLITKDFTPESIAHEMKRLIDDKELCDRLAKTGREEALQRFGLKKWKSEIEKVYREAAK